MSDERYARQRVLPQIGAAGQDRLSRAVVLVVGAGALGSPVAELLVRAGVGELRLADRDLVEMSNLQRQTLFGVADVGMPKAVAGAARLAAVNPTVSVVPHVADLNATNVEELADGADVVVEATDNAQSRYLVNDVAAKRSIPWVYGGAVGVEGRVAGFNSFLGGPCLRCLFRDPPAAGELATCDAAGVLNALTMAVGAMQAQVALRMIVEPEWKPTELVSVRMWPSGFRVVDIGEAREVGCPCCGGKQFEFLDAPVQATTTLCGNGTIQVIAPRRVRVDLGKIRDRWARIATVGETKHMLRMDVPGEGLTVTLFADGRLLIRGLEDEVRARAVYDRLVGS